jgi:hypothetical protein
VMKRIAAPMVGGLITSAFLTLEIIPAIVTYWRYEQLLWEKLAEIEPALLRTLQLWRAVIAAGAGLVVAALVARLYVDSPSVLFHLAIALGSVAFATGFIAYVTRRPTARSLVWPHPR